MSAASLVGIPLFLQDVAARMDTVVMIPGGRSTLETIAAGGQIAVSVVVLILLVAIVVVLFALRKTVQELTHLLHSSYGDISAAAHSVRNVAEDVRGITQSVKTDYGAISDTVRHVNTGVRRAVRRAESRLRRLDALVSVAQEEAEEFVISSASALRGVRFGAAALRRTFQFTKGRNIKRRKRRQARDTDRRERSGDRPRIRPRVVDAS
jgi:hypothetical protein